MDSEEIAKEEETVEEPLTPPNTEVAEEEENSEVKTVTEPKLAKVEYDYEAKEPDELSLNVNDIITVLEQNGGWWKGDLNGKSGIFPANHVKLIEVPTQSTIDEDDEGVKKKNLNKYGVKPGGLGSLFSGGVPTLKKRSYPSPENSSVSEEKHVIASPPVLKKTSVPSPINQQPNIPLPNLPPKKKPPKPKKAEPKAEVIYDYDAEGDDEISLIPGTIVTIIEKDDEGWWTGRNEQGKVGMFPSTYVKEIKQTEVQQKRQSVSEDATVEEVERQESSEVPVTITQEVFTSEPASVSADSPPSSIHSSSYEVNNEDSPTLPKSPPPPMKRTTNETSSPPTTNRRSTYDATASKRRSTHESTSPTSPRNSSHDVEEHVISRRPPSLVSPDLPPIQSISTNFGSTDTSPISPKERPTAPPRQSSRPLSLHENKTESQKSPTLAKPPKSFSPAKPPVVSPVKRSSSTSSKSDKTKNENSPTEPVSPKINRKTSYDQHDSSTSLPEPSEPENKDNDIIEDEKQTEEVAEKPEIREEVDKEAEVSDNEENEEKDEEVNTEDLDKKDDDDTTGGHEVEPEEKKPQSQLPPLPTGPKLTSLQKDRPAIKNRKTPSAKSIKESASQSQTAILLESVSSTKDEVEQKAQPVAAPPTPPKPEKPEKPVKPSTFKLPTLGAGGIHLRPVAKKPSIETSTESTETTSSTTSSGIDTKPISGGVKGISSRFNQFGGIPNSSADVELRLKKWFNEEINKVKSNFEAKLAEERSKREALEEEFRELIASLQENQ
ncbi:hypothetical protein RhiirA4_453080 [Rhizophagus irregularis]|uniref:SH3 domain-containing protein n=1 Tax=Rhizophagus irregularis TaxID=588596 RepID=A0A2I1FZL8_9GLOM|nr:hypothetical protein RhiirA4_453080 [Rhizophagus irregularis]